jgi:outer membrane protein assembly factor BamB
MSRPAALSVVLAVLAASPEVRGQAPEWPHVRGPNYDAVAPAGRLADAWPAGGPPVLWTRELGQGYSGFVAAGGRVYTQFQSRTGQFVVALDAHTGVELWRQRVDWPWQPAGEYPGPYATPTFAAGRLYYATPAGVVGCLDAADGGSLWSVNVREKFQGRGTEFGYAATPLIANGRVILPVGGPEASLVALDAATGATVWAAGEDTASYCPAFPITVAGRRLVVGYLRNCLVAHDAATGERVWREEFSADYDEHAAWPLYAEPYLFIAAPFKVGCRAYRVTADGPPRTAWGSRALSNDVCSSVLVGGHVYGFDLQQLQASAHRTSRGRFKCLDLTSGAVRWETDRVGHATALAADGKLVLWTDTGTLILARANPEGYGELARAQVLDGGIGWTPPALWNGRLYLRNGTRAACVFVGPPADRPAGSGSATESMPAQRFDWGQLLTREPEFPHDAPSTGELTRWFAWSVGGVFGGAAVVAAIACFAARLTRRVRPTAWAGVAFAAAATVLGLAGTSLFSALADTFVLTWPAALYTAFRVTLAVVSWAEAKPAKGRGRPRLIARVVTLLFLASCYGYYRLCLEVGYAMAWTFLAGFLPAAPAVVVAVRARRWWLAAVADAIGFAVFFWTSGLLPGWKDRWAG